MAVTTVAWAPPNGPALLALSGLSEGGGAAVSGLAAGGVRSSIPKRPVSLLES